MPSPSCGRRIYSHWMILQGCKVSPLFRPLSSFFPILKDETRWNSKKLLILLRN
uniref:Predicted protein n=1 Tax=Hordeum vulgare subsp. vulgare TaxID=112509 RepID=F2EIX0_HORVV|nr:predicted protein [Hordeum vulgare subsp. vulgare]